VWLRRYSDPVDPQVRLVCFPHAGGAASAYAHWAAALPPTWRLDAVKYPGREDRFVDPPSASLEDMAQDIAAELAPAACAVLPEAGSPPPAEPDVPCVLFGHSMGSFLAYEVASLRQEAHRRVDLLVVSGAAPHIDPDAMTGRITDDPSTGELLESQLLDIDPDSSLALSDPELRGYVLRTLSCDLDLLAHHRLSGTVLDGVPMLALNGRDDIHNRLEEVVAWSKLTTGPFAQWVFPGGHFYLRDQMAPVIRSIESALTLSRLVKANSISRHVDRPEETGPRRGV